MRVCVSVRVYIVPFVMQHYYWSMVAVVLAYTSHCLYHHDGSMYAVHHFIATVQRHIMPYHPRNIY